MARFRLKDSHPLSEKFNKLENAANELGIYLYFDDGRMFATDTSTGLTAEVADIEEQPHYNGSQIFNFPPDLDYKLLIQKE